MEKLEDGHMKQDRLLRVVLVLTGMAVILSAIIMYLGLPKIFSANEASLAVKKSGEVQGCRAAYAAEVTGENTALLQLMIDGLVSTKLEDEDTIAAIISSGPNGEPSLYEQITSDADRALNDYKNAIELSQHDPSRFLEECHKRF